MAGNPLNPAEPKGKPQGAGTPEAIRLRKRCDDRMVALDAQRWSWWATWRELGRFIQPRLARFLETPNEGTRGRQKNHLILNNVGSIAAQRFASGLMAGVCSPARPWFKLGMGWMPDDIDEAPVKVWLDECEKRMREVFSRSNFYRSVATVFENVGVFGIGPMLVYEDFDDVIRCYPMATGEAYLAVDHRLEVTVFGRRFVMNVAELVGRFGLEAVSPTVARCYRDGQHDQEFMVAHLIMPNDDRVVGALGPRGMPWLEVYWEWGSGADLVLEVKGFHEKPFLAPRWNVTANDAYGRSPGMDALGDIKQLMVMEKRLAQAIEKVVNPPMVADAVLRNEPATLIPGGVTYIPQGAQNVGFKPAYEIKPDIPAMVNAIAKVEGRIKATFFEDLFLMISQLDTVRTATEIAERKEEKMLMLGPALERLHDELLRPAIERTWEIMQRNRLLPPPPPALAPGQFVAVEFISTLAQAQKAVATAAIERVFGFAGNIAAIKPDIMDSLDADEALREYSDMVGAPPKIVVDPRKVAQLRAARAQQQQQQLALQSGLAAAQGAKTLADTDVGGGMNALQRMTGLAA